MDYVIRSREKMEPLVEEAVPIETYGTDPAGAGEKQRAGGL